MNIVILRELLLFYVLGLVFLLIKLVSSDLVKSNRRILAIILFPVCLATEQGRTYLKKIIHGKDK